MKAISEQAKQLIVKHDELIKELRVASQEESVAMDACNKAMEKTKNLQSQLREIKDALTKEISAL